MNRIKSFFKAFGSGASANAHSDKNLAAAALMVEAAAMDGAVGAREKGVIRALLTNRLGLDASEADILLAEALTAQSDATHLMRFTRTLKDTMGEAGRVELVEMLWRVAAADGVIHDYEDNLIRRVAGLLYVSDRARGEAKKRALGEAG
ncbi:MAG TPA: TerB family tellurite resistance protein, partial [Sphingomonadales bacterium]|nr:TerB family tellurite resistance protein [Sphingomonadales bacterium]